MTSDPPFRTIPVVVPRRTKACRIQAFGPPSAIVMEEVELPNLAPGEMLVRVEAAGVGPWDGWIRAGRSVLPQPLPLTLGSDLSGTIAGIGPDVTGFKLGDEVFGVTNPQFTGAYAEFAIVVAGMVSRKPSRLDHIGAASMPVVAVTAWQALFAQADVRAGQTVLIHGAAGSVGACAVQFAHRAGAKVIATASAGDIGYVKGLGADVVLDHRAGHFEEVAAAADAVVDLVGGEVQTRSFAMLKRGGVLVSAVSAPDQALAAAHGVRAMFFLVAVNTVDLTRIAALVDDNRLSPNVGAILPLSEARAAHEMLEGIRSRPRGKIVLRIEV